MAKSLKTWMLCSLTFERAVSNAKELVAIDVSRKDYVRIRAEGIQQRSTKLPAHRSLLLIAKCETLLQHLCKCY